MSSIQSYRSQAGVARDASRRQMARAVERVEAKTCVDVALVDAVGELNIAKAGNLVAVTGHALAGAQFVTNLEMALAEATPAAMTRLKQIGDVGSLGLAQIVVDAATDLRRV